ncbi:GNAT family N-acetyltransferase [Paenibacillus sp. HWE-109]|uniref:GNAT family N-acetyltransferase n=1 Tax=Paenibacillus sp. HWE-109 TaxID=1306526 RepID=UPI001EDE5B61|nr:GNAT family N-acyltransferase [Paenibacillus sp. HWE-109]UKS29000.1 GNAT family N-acetyltransferase [Paenibacillus sp. HWE-109]
MSGLLLNTAPRKTNLSVMLANRTNDIEQALRLRYQVFVVEENNMLLHNEDGLERDAYDAYCDHLIVKDLDMDKVIGTYRLLPGDRALTGIGFYSETEFDLTSYTTYKKQSLELGRSCIAPEYRGGRAIQLLWEGIAGYIAERNYSHLIGCASVHVNQVEELNLIYSLLLQKQMITDRYGIKPLATHLIQGIAQIPIDSNDKDVFRKLPPLMKGYQWLGAEIGGEPAYDALFKTVDFFIVLQKERITKRYKRHFLAE